mmetsp:Transcript_40860/g.95401  ORF Transcript_40860/g.95401 Transcript_40860/m.95401 type:complete len:299 (+) Transcript_40860:455-1351(+)
MSRCSGLFGVILPSHFPTSQGNQPSSTKSGRWAHSMRSSTSHVTFGSARNATLSLERSIFHQMRMCARSFMCLSCRPPSVGVHQRSPRTSNSNASLANSTRTSASMSTTRIWFWVRLVGFSLAVASSALLLARGPAAASGATDARRAMAMGRWRVATWSEITSSSRACSTSDGCSCSCAPEVRSRWTLYFGYFSDGGASGSPPCSLRWISFLPSACCTSGSTDCRSALKSSAPVHCGRDPWRRLRKSCRACPWTVIAARSFRESRAPLLLASCQLRFEAGGSSFSPLAGGSSSMARVR